MKTKNKPISKERNNLYLIKYPLPAVQYHEIVFRQEMKTATRLNGPLHPKALAAANRTSFHVRVMYESLLLT